MKIFSSLKSCFEPKYEPSLTVRNKIRLGDTLAGRVLKVKDGGLALFDFNGTKAWAHVTFPVKEGEVIEVSVMENRPRLKLKRVAQTATGSSPGGRVILLSNFPTQDTVNKLQFERGNILGSEGGMAKSKTLPRKITAGIEQLFSHFQQLDMGKNVSALSARLRSYIENSGIFFEKRIENEMQNLYRSNTEISTRHLLQSPEIRDIIKSDLKPCLLILKHFIYEGEPKPQKGITDHLQHLKPLINQMLKSIGVQQAQSATIQHGQKVGQEVVYTDPRKGDDVDIPKTPKMVPVITSLTPKLLHFLKTAGLNLDEKIHHSISKWIDTFEIPSSRENFANPPFDETTIRNILKEDIPQHLKRLEEFFRYRAATSHLFDTKELEDIKKSLTRVRAEVESWQVTADAGKKAQKPEAGQVMAFTLPLPEGTGKGKLKIFYSRKRKSRTNEGFKMSLLLQMENTGAVRTDFFLLDKQLKITFYLNDQKIEKIIHTHADSIKTALAEHFSRVLLNVVVSERKVEDFEIEHLLTENRGLIDLRV